MQDRLTPAHCLPSDDAAVLVGRAWLPGEGPGVVAVRGDALHDLSRVTPTMRDLLEADDPVALARGAAAPPGWPSSPSSPSPPSWSACGT